MSIDRDTLLKTLNHELKPELYQDYCPNGLQIEGQSDIKKIVTGVTACQQLIDKAIEIKADTILVHHGYFWKNEASVLVGMKHQRISKIIKNNINLIAYHLPLDGHPTMGNNAQLASIMQWDIKGGLEPTSRPIGNWGTLLTPLTHDQLTQQLKNTLHRKPVTIAAGNHIIRSIAWCTGGAQRQISSALKLGVDAYVSGEISEDTVHFARENNIHYFSAGHHATERYGVKAIGNWLAQQFPIEHQFIDIPSPA